MTADPETLKIYTKCFKAFEFRVLILKNMMNWQMKKNFNFYNF